MADVLDPDRPAWQDYVNYWRSADATWLEDRSILRFATPASRDTAVVSPGAGQLVYITSQDIYQWRSSTNVWKNFIPLPGNLIVSQDDGFQVSLTHSGSVGKGLQIGAASVSVNNAFNAPSFGATVAGITVKTGGKTALLSTDAVNLISDTPVSVPKLTVTSGGISATGQTLTIGDIVVNTLAVTTSIGLAGTLTGGVLNGTGGTIGGVLMGSNLITASGGLQSQQGQFFGDSNSAIVQRLGGTPRVVVSGTEVALSGGTTRVANPFNVQNAPATGTAPTGIQLRNFAGTLLANAAFVVYSASDPGVANLPDGSLWLSS